MEADMKKLSKNLTSKWSLKKPLYIEPKDVRYSKYVKQLKTNGFCDCETWGLDSVISEFILPRLIRFKELNNGFPGGINGMTFEMWNSILDEMIFAFDWSLHHEDEKYDKLLPVAREIKWDRYNQGMKYFAEYFRQLWW